MAHARPRRLIALVLLAGVTLFIGAWLGATPRLSAAQSPVTPVAMGGGEFVFGPGDEMSAAAAAAILAEIAQNQEKLYRTGRLALPEAGATVALAWPLRPAADFVDFSYYAVSYFVDNDPAFPDSVRDYNNGTRSYDTDGGYNHGGTDYFLWPFGWLKMDSNAVEVVAAAAGVIVGKSDGNGDRSCGYTTNPWNAVYVQHADGTIAWYGHLKRNSLTTKAVGAAVVTGEYLGLVGSSGFSTAPHLHFEIRSGSSSGSQAVDPYFGPGNPTLPQSLWQSQPGYYEPAILHLGAGATPPLFPACPQQEQPHEQQLFDRGDTVLLSAYYRDQLQGQVSELRVLRPDGTVHAAWTHASPAVHYMAAYWWWNIVIPESAQKGAWRFQVTYQGKEHERSFFVGEMPPPTATMTVTPTPTATTGLTGTLTSTPTPTMTPSPTVTTPPDNEETPNPYPSPVKISDFQFLPYVTQ